MPYDETLAERVRALFQGEPTYTKKDVPRNLLHGWPQHGHRRHRQAFCVSFRIAGHPETKPYEIMAVNAHLYFGDYISDRRQEFNALTEWILTRLKTETKAY